MLTSLLFGVVVAINVGLIVRFLLAPLQTGVNSLANGFARSRRYPAARLTALREKALRERTLRLIHDLGIVVLRLCGIVACYLPSMFFAIYRSNLALAFYSIEALTGMLAGGLFVYLRRTAS